MSIEYIGTQPADRPEVVDVFRGLIPQYPRLGAPDEAWSPLALALRHTLETLSPVTNRRCLPGEAEDCAGSFEEHALAYLGHLTGWCLAQLGHWKLTPRGIDVAAQIAAERIADIDSQVGHGHVEDVAALLHQIGLNVKARGGNQ